MKLEKIFHVFENIFKFSRKTNNILENFHEIYNIIFWFCRKFVKFLMFLRKCFWKHLTKLQKKNTEVGWNENKVGGLVIYVAESCKTTVMLNIIILKSWTWDGFQFYVRATKVVDHEIGHFSKGPEQFGGVGQWKEKRKPCT